MLSATCHCGTIRIEIPSLPRELTNCNCSICRRLGGLWAYYNVGTVKVHGHPEHTQEYVQGDKTLRTVRCKTCGCTTHWEPLDPKQHTKLGVNIRNFAPEVIGNVRIRLLDGADTWKSFYWEDIHGVPPPTPGFVEDQITAVEERLRLAMLASDVETLAELMSPQLVFTNHLGQVLGKAADLELHRSGVLKFHTLEPSETQMRAGAESAVVSVRMQACGSYADAPFAADLRFTRVWRRSDGGAWQIVAGHSSAVQA